MTILINSQSRLKFSLNWSFTIALPPILDFSSLTPHHTDLFPNPRSFFPELPEWERGRSEAESTQNGLSPKPKNTKKSDFFIKIMSFFIEIFAFSIEISAFSIEILSFFIEKMSFFYRNIGFFYRNIDYFYRNIEFFYRKNDFFYKKYGRITKKLPIFKVSHSDYRSCMSLILLMFSCERDPEWNQPY